MGKTGSNAKRSKRKEKQQKERRRQSMNQSRKEKAELYFDEALWYMDSQNYGKAANFLKKAIKRDPDNKDAIIELIRIGELSDQPHLIIDGLLQLYERGLLENTPHDNEGVLHLCRYLIRDGRYRRAREIAEALRDRFNELCVNNGVQFRKDLAEIISYTAHQCYMETWQHPENPLTPTAIMRIQTPAKKIVSKLSVGRRSRQFFLTYNPVTRAIDPPACHQCDKPITQIHFNADLEPVCFDCR